MAHFVLSLACPLSLPLEPLSTVFNRIQAFCRYLAYAARILCWVLDRQGMSRIHTHLHTHAQH